MDIEAVFSSPDKSRRMRINEYSINIVANMPHYNLRETEGSTLKQLTIHIINHMNKMANRLDEYVYPAEFTKHPSDHRYTIDLMSDLVVMADLIRDIHSYVYYDDWTVEWWD